MLPAPGIINTVGSYSNVFSDQDNSPWLTGYRIYFPFTAAQGVSTIPLPSSSSTISASYVYDINAGFYSDQVEYTQKMQVNFGVYQEDSKTQDNTYMVNKLYYQNDDLNDPWKWQGIKQVDIEAGHKLNLKCICYYSNSAPGTYSQYLQWYTQFLYNGFVNIFN
jgi:hypothetical protein